MPHSTESTRHLIEKVHAIECFRRLVIPCCLLLAFKLVMISPRLGFSEIVVWQMTVWILLNNTLRNLSRTDHSIDSHTNLLISSFLRIDDFG